MVPQGWEGEHLTGTPSPLVMVSLGPPDHHRLSKESSEGRSHRGKMLREGKAPSASGFVYHQHPGQMLLESRGRLFEIPSVPKGHVGGLRRGFERSLRAEITLSLSHS